VAPDLIAAEHVANEQLPEVYASAAVVLNDHWETMRAWGIVSNRIYDVLACGTPVVSDRLPEIDDQLPDGVLTFADADELGHQVRELLADPEAAASRAAAGRAAVLAAHTLDHRADQLLTLLARHGLDQAQQ
jgi:spore maturation protein CgeB